MPSGRIDDGAASGPKPRASFVGAIACCAGALLLFAPAQAKAQNRDAPAAHQQAEARSRAEDGFKLFGRERWKEALDRFREAESIYHAPSLVLYMARCERKLGHLVAARDLYEKVVTEPIARDAPAAYTEAQQDARRELEDLRGRIPSIQLVVTGVPADTARATIDGTPMPVLRERIELDPGAHVIEAMSERAKRPERREITLAEGAAERVEIALEARLRAEPPPPAAGAPVPETPAARPARGSFVPAGITLGVGAAGFVAAGVTGALSLSKVADIKSRCHGEVCLASDAGAAAGAKTLGNVSTAMLVIGSAAAVTGVVLAVLRPGGAKPQPTTAVSVTPALGLGSFSIAGRF